MQKIGVFVCWCGSNIAATVDVTAVSEALSHEAGVVFSTNYQYMCSQTGQELMQEKIRTLGLTGVVVCSCSPRMHEATFRKACEKAGLNPYLVEVANIREQCSWIHKDRALATQKAIILGRAAIAKVRRNTPLTAMSSPVTKRALDANAEIMDAIDDVLTWYQARDLFKQYENELGKLCVDNVLYDASVRILKAQSTHPLLPQLLDFTAARFPDYRHNPYLKGYPARKKLVLSLLGKKQYRAVHILFAAAGH